jgi:phytoene dehydrogenase-like protein
VVDNIWESIKQYEGCMSDYDAIVVGSGHNGLVCALYLARAGWRTLVLERSNEIGGGVRSGAFTLPGFCHDRYATNMGQFAASAVYRELKSEFDRTGLRFLRSESVYANVYEDGQALRVYTDPDRTQHEFETTAAGDGEGWLRLSGLHRRTARLFAPLFTTEIPSAAMWTQLFRILSSGPGDAYALARLFRQSSGDFARSFFRSDKAIGMLASWAYHLDFGPNVPGGALFSFVTALSAHAHGLPIVQGGAGQITASLRALIEGAGGRLMTGSGVREVVVRNRRAAAVRLDDGTEISATRAVIANVTPRNLFGSLISPDHLNARFVKQAKQYRYGPGTFIIHLAVDRLPSWIAADDLSAFTCIHINGTEAQIADTYRQSLQGCLPAEPLLVVSQTTSTDPSRAPPGKHIVRVHIRTVPGHISGDAMGKIAGRTWGEVKQAYCDRILDQVERHAPGFRSSVLATSVETPEDIERENPNFIGGDGVSGSCHPDQNFFRRPFYGWSRYRTPVQSLYMVGAATWPGGGVNASSGYLGARAILGS